VQSLLRIIQSIPSPKAEPFKQWLAKVGSERIKEIVAPEQSIDRARESWKQKQGNRLLQVKIFYHQQNLKRNYHKLSLFAKN